MVDILDRINDFFVQKLWDIDINSLSRFRVFLIKVMRLLYVAIRGFTEEQLALRAMSLVYTTLLSLVPLLAVSFSVLKAFGVHTRIEIFLYYFLEPLGAKGVDLSLKIIGFVENVKASILGSIGLAMLIYTVMSQVQKLESALNYIWNAKGVRSFNQRFSNYMSVLLIGPVLIFSAIGLTASLMSTAVVKKLQAIEPFGTLIYSAGQLIPYALICAAFTFIYIFLPNTKVYFRPAIVGGVFAGVLWRVTGMVFTSFILSSAQYSVIYSGFALLILFLIWLYWSFFILLVGARVSFYQQYPRHIAVRKKKFLLSNRLREKLSLMIMFLIGCNFYSGIQPWKFDSLTKRLGLPPEPVQDVLESLEKKRLIVLSGEEPPSYLPARDIETIPLHEIVDAVRRAGDDIDYRSLPTVENIMELLDGGLARSLEYKTLKDVVLSGK